MKGLVFARAKTVPEYRQYSITPNKLYINARWDGYHSDEETMYIIDNIGVELFILENNCAAIGYNNWEFIRPSELGELI